MEKIFSHPSSPFYRSTSFLTIDSIIKELYADFIEEKFLNHKKTINRETITEILDWTNTHTFYVQMLFSRIFLSCGKKVTTEDWRSEAFKILKENEPVFFSYRDLLSKPQWNLLKAVALEGEAYQLTSNEFCVKHNLGNPSTVYQSVKSLKNKELIYNKKDPDGNTFISVYDVFFRRWVETV